MAETKADSLGSAEELSEGLILVGRIVKTAIKTSVTIIFGLVVLLGTCSVYEAFFPESTPELRFLATHQFDSISLYNVCPTPETEASQWAEVESALEVLDVVCPQVSEWVRDRRDHDKLTLYVERQDVFAAYDFFSKRLTLSSLFYSQSKGMRAVTLAHEYRHSLQSQATLIKRIIFIMITGDKHESLIEGPAEQFELETKLAIFHPHIHRQ